MVLQQLQIQQGFLKNLGYSFHDSSVKQQAEKICLNTENFIEKIRNDLSQLSESYSMAVVSNFYGNLGAVLEELGISNLFSLSIDSALVGISKPDAGIYRKCLEELHCRAEEALMIGDSYERDIVPAKSLGMKTLWLKGRSWKEEKGGPCADCRISSLEGVSDYIKNNFKYNGG